MATIPSTESTSCERNFAQPERVWRHASEQSAARREVTRTYRSLVDVAAAQVSFRTLRVYKVLNSVRERASEEPALEATCSCLPFRWIKKLQHLTARWMEKLVLLMKMLVSGGPLVV